MKIKWLIVERQGWYLGECPSGESLCSVGHWFADSSIAFKFDSEDEARKNLAEHRLLCRAGAIDCTDGSPSRPMTCLCVGASVESLSWPDGKEVAA